MVTDSALLQTLAQCVARLERQPLSVDMRTEIESACAVAEDNEEVMAGLY